MNSERKGGEREREREREREKSKKIKNFKFPNLEQ